MSDVRHLALVEIQDCALNARVRRLQGHPGQGARQRERSGDGTRAHGGERHQSVATDDADLAHAVGAAKGVDAVCIHLAHEPRREHLRVGNGCNEKDE